MINRTALLLILGLCAVCLLPLQASALPMVGFSLKPSPASGPYQDKDFLEQANKTIYGLSNKTLPTGTALTDLRTVQGKISKMNISPSLYSNATDINAFIYYTWKSGDEYEDASSLGDSFYSPVTSDSSLYDDANEYYEAAKTTWDRIKSRYPGATLYTMPKPSTVIADTGSYDPYTHGSTNKGARSGLW
ncbi:MAG TPA: hypothetical protein VN429_06130 [Methanospirillum sp.]|uniref:hypothetical protein n=1 Tax=Methanospirillum sp. TaxID=45200 RepID=UPI002BD77115|nr:hypothetical protein [Methanospirillum sp.]HWQ63976.1 hypothetical protein [Methanospirillum sp.]